MLAGTEAHGTGPRTTPQAHTLLPGAPTFHHLLSQQVSDGSVSAQTQVVFSMVIADPGWVQVSLGAWATFEACPLYL